MADTTEVEVRTRATEMARWLQDNADSGMTMDDPVAFQMDIAERILSMDTLEDILAAQNLPGSIAGKEFTDVPIEFFRNEVKFILSTQAEYNQTFPYYVLIDAVRLDTGERVTINCGAFTIVSVLYACISKGLLSDDKGLTVSFKSADTASGNTRLFFQPYSAPKSTRAKK